MEKGIVTDAFPPEVGGVQTFAHQYVTKLAHSPGMSHVSVLVFVSSKKEERSNLSVQWASNTKTQKNLQGIQIDHPTVI